MSLFYSSFDSICTDNIKEIVKNQQFVQLIIRHFNTHINELSIIIPIPLERIKHETATDAMYAVAIMMTAKMFMKRYVSMYTK